MTIYAVTPKALTFFHDGRSHQIHNDHPKYNDVLDALKDDDGATAVELAKPIAAVATALATITNDSAEADRFRRKAGNLVVTDWGVKLDGVALHGVVIDRLLTALREGLDITPWKNFVTKLYQNPSSASRNELYLWLEKCELPITPDGDFLAYKRVRDSYRDIHSNTMDNSVGKVVSMDRLDVDDDRNQTCSAGLHFCSADYLPHFGSSSGNRVVLVKVNPADVVSIPSDYDNAKGRTWRYQVVADVTEEFSTKVWGSYTDQYGTNKVVEDDSDDEYTYGEYSYDDGDYNDVEEDEDELTLGDVFAAYRRKYGSDAKDGAERELRLYRASRVLEDFIESFNDLLQDDWETLVAAWS